MTSTINPKALAFYICAVLALLVSTGSPGPRMGASTLYKPYLIWISESFRIIENEFLFIAKDIESLNETHAHPALSFCI